MADAHAQRAQAIARARIQFLALIHGGTTEAERTTPLISLDALAEHEDTVCCSEIQEVDILR